MQITSQAPRGPSATSAVRNSNAFDPNLRVHLRFVEFDDVAFMGAISPGPSILARRQWIQHYKALEAQGHEFNFIIVENGLPQGLVRMHDFATIGGEPSFRWGDFISVQPGLLTPTALAIYSIGFDTLGFARAHMTVPKTSPDIATFHLETGAKLEFDDGDHQYFRYGAETYQQVRNEALDRFNIIESRRA
jgi:hypothetical protein